MQPPLLLVCDDAPDTADVLEAVYTPRGVVVNRLRSGQAVPPAPAETPAVLVLNSAYAAAAPASQWDAVPRVLIGRAHGPGEPSPVVSDRAPQCRRLASPFQFRELIQAIDQLLSRSAA
jgi:hypothetical protein